MRTAHIICLLIVFICIASAGCVSSKEYTTPAATNQPATIATSNIKSFDLSPAEASGTVGYTIDFTAKAFNENGQSVPITWSIGSGSGSINNGVLTPYRAGEIIIIAMAGNVAKTAKANIESDPYYYSRQYHNGDRVSVYINNDYRHNRRNNHDDISSKSIYREIRTLCNNDHDHPTPGCDS